VGGACILSMAVLLLIPILWPPIISYPWQFTNTAKERRQVVVLAGSFNPPHNGHLAMLQYLSKRYGHVIAIVGMNPQKKYLVSPKERAELLREMLKEHPDTANVRVEVVSGLIWRFAKQHGATVFFRGIRSWKKDGREERSLQILNTWGPLVLGPTWPLPTMYLEGNPEFNHISSTLIRNLCHGEGSPPNEALSKLVPSSVVDTVANLYSRKEK